MICYLLLCFEMQGVLFSFCCWMLLGCVCFVSLCFRHPDVFVVTGPAVLSTLHVATVHYMVQTSATSLADPYSNPRHVQSLGVKYGKQCRNLIASKQTHMFTLSWLLGLTDKRQERAQR
jgi:hypothetical protein